MGAFPLSQSCSLNVHFAPHKFNVLPLGCKLCPNQKEHLFTSFQNISHTGFIKSFQQNLIPWYFTNITEIQFLLPFKSLSYCVKTSAEESSADEFWEITVGQRNRNFTRGLFFLTLKKILEILKNPFKICLINSPSNLSITSCCPSDQVQSPYLGPEGPPRWSLLTPHPPPPGRPNKAPHPLFSSLLPSKCTLQGSAEILHLREPIPSPRHTQVLLHALTTCWPSFLALFKVFPSFVET